MPVLPTGNSERLKLVVSSRQIASRINAVSLMGLTHVLRWHSHRRERDRRPREQGHASPDDPFAIGEWLDEQAPLTPWRRPVARKGIS
ncbi:hypothetical protein [Novosphingobium sp. CECT 9465]|uniref:hypothetical protein n=1 Tax=Novosphingobium sp. CECT 9465 TaxID=2829794 RepID=UPI001E457AF5|nr:hypothetical protein [Novosphingobium sp. CECT 9465]